MRPNESSTRLSNASPGKAPGPPEGGHYKYKLRRVLLRSVVAIASLVVAVAVTAAPLARFLIVTAEPLSGDAVVVLSGASVYEERIDHGISLFKAGQGRSIILTNDGLRRGWSRRRQANPTSVERARDALVDAGIDESQMTILQQRVRSTYDEALVVRDYAASHGLRHLVVVTSPYHSRRALWTFRRVLAPSGVQVGMSPVPLGQQSPPPWTWWLTRHGWQQVALEYVKLVYYVVKHV